MLGLDSKQLRLVLERKAEPFGNLKVLARQFAAADPFPRIVFDDFFDPQLLDAVLAEMPGLTRAAYDPNWVVDDYQNLRKFNTRSPLAFGTVTTNFAALLHSAGFLDLVSTITGIPALIPDPYMHGGGFHFVPRGGKFNVHVDSNIHRTTGLVRRIACITFLNHDWKSEYAGNLELWDTAGKACRASIAPVFGRTIIFESSDRSYHGYPTPIACPPGTGRKSFLTYYYTAAGTLNGPAPSEHSTLYAPAYPHYSLRGLFEDLAPPLFTRAVKRLRAMLRDQYVR